MEGMSSNNNVNNEKNSSTPSHFALMTRLFSSPRLKLIHFCRQGNALGMRQKQKRKEKKNPSSAGCVRLISDSDQS